MIAIRRLGLEPFSLPRRARPTWIAGHSVEFRRMARDRRVRTALATASVIAALVVAWPAAAQGNSGSAPGKNKDKKSTPPSSSSLPTLASGASSASPLSWIDDASLLPPGSAAFTISVLRWSGADLSEVYAPVVDAAYGVAKRFQLSATIPHIVGSADGTGPVGGWGTSYFSGKIALLDESDDSGVKLALSPLLEVLSEGAVQSLPAGESRFQVGLPVSVEVARGSVRMFAATGLFSRGAWFAGGGAGFQLTPRMGASMNVNRSWAKTDVEGVHRDRSEISGGVYYFVQPQIAVYGSVGHTIATTDENGAGMTIGTGVTFLLVPHQPTAGKPRTRR
jgi:hypothetical protein